jgi:hypothetical protein
VASREGEPFQEACVVRGRLWWRVACVAWSRLRGRARPYKVKGWGSRRLFGSCGMTFVRFSIDRTFCTYYNWTLFEARRRSVSRQWESRDACASSWRDRGLW